MTTTTPRVTVGLPVRNGERHLRAAIESILGQTYGDLELVVSDNASTDATAEICAAYASDPRVRYERQPVDIGARENFHLVLSRARGEYFKWAACDDVLAPTFLERCVEALDADPGAVLAAADIEVIDDAGEPLGRWRRPITVGG
ncbi:MAG TPA: glycosyltransferase, partial [Acidimicrobiales bacterium]|nr:glycosyltransferase [Acidimicrobiales bacterium]